MGLMDEPPFPDQMYKDLGWCDVQIIAREGWGALPATSEEPFDSHPVTPLVMNYTETPQCNTKTECVQMMQDLQKKHMAEGMSDIRYSFVVGGDMKVYEGRGFFYKTGVHPKYPELQGNNFEIAISGTRGSLPGLDISTMAWRLQDQGVWDGYLNVRPEVYQDYVDPPPPVSSDQVEVQGGIQVEDWYGGKVPEGVVVPEC